MIYGKRYEGLYFSLFRIESFVKIFKGVGHGWASRYSEDNEFVERSAEVAKHVIF
ncbi:hypothetical protein HanPSC8_Chr07g0283841 [Helianthus annuus]|nr:hypothetical protein HanPSC8_Chr07g0283841 [Helianthus annuus]